MKVGDLIIARGTGGYFPLKELCLVEKITPRQFCVTAVEHKCNEKTSNVIQGVLGPRRVINKGDVLFADVTPEQFAAVVAVYEKHKRELDRLTQSMQGARDAEIAKVMEVDG